MSKRLFVFRTGRLQSAEISARTSNDILQEISIVYYVINASMMIPSMKQNAQNENIKRSE